MAPKGGSGSNGKQQQQGGGGGKKGKKNNNDDDDFDALLANAVRETQEAKNKQQKNNKNNKGDQQQQQHAHKGDGSKNNHSGTEEENNKPKVISTADHPENPYPQVAEGMKRQTWPEPTVPVCEQFAYGNYPAGEIHEHPGEINAFRYSSEEKRALERVTEEQVQDLRHAAEVHRQVRRYANSFIKPGISLISMTNRIERKLEELIVKDGLVRGQAFPTGCSLNHVAAHYTPNTGDNTVLTYDDVMKVDFGTQIHGRIIDSAWTVAFNEEYNPLLNAVKEATYEGVKQAGIDVRLCDVGAAIQEVMESHEVEIKGKVYPVKSIRNLSGHNIGSYIIHSGKSVPIVRGGEAVKMEEGELFAIETFGSTGRGLVQEDMECSHYMMAPGAENIQVRSDKAQQLLRHIHKTYGTLAFARKWLDRDGFDRHLLNLNQLVEAGAVNKYPPLCDVKGCYTAQFEHTILLKPTAKEILSKGDDY
ncbi:methionine aminopeptidase 2 [Trypanosoma theileri]|uniref:Methionine aminopeptidase 2 n=1 Tax=Trypanosoma theileri TaxID=67003 RepID=A0A1X0NXP2_9TRYP|nr:methionine aminopeptidase 2 [Trypanosoma theileri]ORC89457.1 methionine aminopeptidase 2 [Trypanosoma theileri]